MIRGYFRTAWRNLIKHRLFTFIHIIGLAVGVAASLLIFLFVHNELTYDRHHEYHDRIARITTTLHTPEADDLALATSPYLLADALKQDYPEVEAAVRIESSSITVRYEDNLISEPGFYEADQSIFSVFSLPVIAGSEVDALSEPNTMVLTEKLARKYFTTPEDAIGKTLVSGQQPLRVTAVIADQPANADIRIQGLLSASFSRASSWMEGDFPVYTFVLFKQQLALAGFEQKIQQLADRYLQPELDALGASDYHVSFGVEALADVHFSQGKQMDTPKGNRQINYVFSLLALFILIIALLNYVNLSTARAFEKGKEVGVRKVSGARPIQLMWQFIIESLLLVGLAWVIAMGLVLLAIPYVNQLLFTDLSLHLQNHLIFLATTFVFTTFMASLYPAFVLAGYRPIDVLKGERKIPSKGGWSRKAIVVFQFATAIVLIIGTLVVYQQIQYITHPDQSFSVNQVASIRVPTDSASRGTVNGFHAALRQRPEVRGVTVGNGVQGIDIAKATTLGMSNGEPRHLFCNYFFVDPDFVPFFKVQLVAGRNLSGSIATDKEAAFLVNEAFVSAMGWSNPIGQPLEGFDRKGEVVGVVKNFYYQSMHNLVEPLAMIYRTEAPWFISIKIPPSNLSVVKTLWQDMFPDRVFDYTFLDDAYAAQYRKDTATMYLFSGFTALAVFISCLGLFGLVTLTTAQRTKEIGIRKVLGASISGIVAMLTKDFVKLVVIAIIVASPLAWWAMNKWLEDFAYRIDIQWWMFAVAGLAAVAIALLTVSWQAIRAAIANPVDSLRDE
ncbi:MAG TPA: ABC transporter permease [Parapedobacter sp.]|nr:ABC transporter permease [Parapedobacter sp.]